MKHLLAAQEVPIMSITTTQTSQPTISSLEIANLLNSRHDSVKRTIERLIESGSISKTPLVDGNRAANGVTQQHYEISKRDSYVVVAQLSPKFTAALVDRWQELEQQAALSAFNIPKSYSEALRLCADQQDIIVEQGAALAIAAPKAEFYDTVMGSNTVCQMAVAAQVAKLPYGRNILFQKLREDGILISGGDRHNMPKQAYINNGFFTVEETAFKHPNTEEPIVKFTTHVTQKGLDYIIKNYGKKEAA